MADNEISKIKFMCAHCGWIYDCDDSAIQAEMCASSHLVKSYRYVNELPFDVTLAIGSTVSRRM